MPVGGIIVSMNENETENRPHGDFQNHIARIRPNLSSSGPRPPPPPHLRSDHVGEQGPRGRYGGAADDVI